MSILNVEAEIIRLHDFFVEWMTGQLDKTDDNFARFSGSMSDDFYIVAPSGQLTERDALVNGLHATHNQRVGLRIWIENVALRHILGDTVIATYEEWQTFDGKTTARLSTVVFTQDDSVPNGLLWRCVHETWLPNDVVQERES